MSICYLPPCINVYVNVFHDMFVKYQQHNLISLSLQVTIGFNDYFIYFINTIATGNDKFYFLIYDEITVSHSWRAIFEIPLPRIKKVKNIFRICWKGHAGFLNFLTHVEVVRGAIKDLSMLWTSMTNILRSSHGFIHLKSEGKIWIKETILWYSLFIWEMNK
jgi:hypothetical protein